MDKKNFVETFFQKKTKKILITKKLAVNYRMNKKNDNSEYFSYHLLFLSSNLVIITLEKQMKNIPILIFHADAINHAY